MGKVAPTLEIRLPAGDIDKVWLKEFLLTLKRQYEEVARVINHQHGVDVAFLAKASVLQGPFSALTTINFTTEEFDLQGDYDGTNTFTAPADGIYHLGSKIRLVGLTIGDEFALGISRGGAVELEARRIAAATIEKIQLHGLLNLNAGDAITVVANRIAGTGTALIPSSLGFTFFYGRAEIIIPSV